MKLKKNILLLLFITLFSCYRNPKERNALVFENKIENVQDSINKLIFFLNKFPDNKDGLNKHYIIKENEIYINESLQDLKRNDLNKFLNGFDMHQRNEFTSLIQYLDINYIKSAYFDKQLGLWCFIYRDIEDVDYDDSRIVVFLDNAKLSNTLVGYSILDKKDKLFLIAPKDAIIR